jgi:hypothetical protein
MASQPNDNRSVLEAKDREQLQEIATAIGVKTPARASKATLITAILGASAPEASTAPSAERASDASAAPTSRPGPIRSRRTVAAPETEFEDLIAEITADAGSDLTVTPAASEATTPARAEREPREPREAREPREPRRRAP